MTYITSLFLVQVILNSFSGLAGCGYDFGSGKDVIFLMDHSRSISDRTISDVEDYLRLLIRKRILIGPDANRTRVTFVTFYATSYEVTGPDYISNHLPVYESELLAPGGVFSSSMRVTRESEKHPTDLGIIEAIEVCKGLFVNDDLKSRQQILILITDFHFEGSNTQKDRLLVKESLTTLQQLIGGTLEVYGVGVGGYFNRTVMDEILAAGNKDGHSGCGKSVKEWYDYLNRVNILPIKDTIGQRRQFHNESLCCFLCQKQSPTTAYANCSLEEFSSGWKLAQSNLMPLNCATTGRPDECQSFDSSSSKTPSTTTSVSDGEEGPEVGIKSPEGPDDDDDDDDDDLESTANRVPMSDTTFSTLGIIFGLVNLALVIIFILIGIYASKKEAPTKYREKVQRSYKYKSNNGTVASSGTAKPTRIAPLPPPQNTSSNAPGPADGRNSSQSGAWPTSSIEDVADETYGNQWVVDENEANARRWNKRSSYFAVWKEDVEINWKRVTQRMSGFISQIVDRDRDYVNEDVIQQQHDKYQDKTDTERHRYIQPRVYNQPKTDNNQHNAHDQQNAHNQQNVYSNRNVGSQQIVMGHVDVELRKKLEARLMKS
ncbi:hypothetical protein LSH36_136g00042 [Paralvinella palmiformis]|uniref:VWFA domain-containing protein n=1 Tax=Paralvinella palmiformis TaxID=53620 RepID=A0AAD9N9E9_9ANNE|nr:hypothetical protein LSH36_136g00042 [Paralvinella palmiformis]